MPTRFPEQLHALRLRQLPDEQGCYLAHLGGCSGRIQAHHPIPKQILKGPLGKRIARAWGITVDDLVADHRNGIRLCREHHHLIHHGREIILEPDDLPVRFWQFVDQFDLQWLVQKLHDRRVAYASRRNGSRPHADTTPSGHG